MIVKCGKGYVRPAYVPDIDATVDLERAWRDVEAALGAPLDPGQRGDTVDSV